MKVCDIKALLEAAGVEFQAGDNKSTLIGLLQFNRVSRRERFEGGIAGDGMEGMQGAPDFASPMLLSAPLTCPRGPGCPPNLPPGTRFCTGCGRTPPPLALCAFCLAPQAPGSFCGRCGRPPPARGLKRSSGDLGRREGDSEFDGSSPSSRSPSLLPSALFRSFCTLHVAAGHTSFVPIALFGLFLPGRSCVPAAGPITGSRSAEWSKSHQAFADAEVISVGPAPC